MIDPPRCRAKVYLDRGVAWCERDWIGAEIGLGTARLRIVSPITRWAATEVNPATTERNLDIPAPRDRNFGHIGMGIHAEVISAGNHGRLRAACPCDETFFGLTRGRPSGP